MKIIEAGEEMWNVCVILLMWKPVLVW